MSTALPSGTRLAGFVLDSPLGQGGFGITYRARNAEGSRDYAIKEYFPGDLAQRAADNSVHPKPGKDNARLFEIGRQAFLKEAYVLRDLPRQPGLVRVRGAFEKHGTAYCLMDFIAGDPLDRVAQRLVARRGHVPEAQVMELISTLCRALGAVHGAGFVHCDVKPANVMIARDGTPVLIDFGAARRLGGARGQGAMLSRRYAAIEQFPNPPKRMNLTEGPWTDLYALSVMLYEIMSQGLPPDAETRARERFAGRSDPCLPIRESMRRNRVEAVYPAALLDLVDRGMGLLPRERPQTAAEYRLPTERLLSVVAEAPFPEVPSVPVMAPISSSPPPSHRTRRSNWGPIARMLAIILCLALLAGAYGLAWGGLR